MVRPILCWFVVAFGVTAPRASLGQAELLDRAVVRNRLYTLAGRTEVGVHGGFSLLARLTEHTNLSGSVAYNLDEHLAIQLRAGYSLSRHTSLADQIAADFVRNTAIPSFDDLSNLWEMKANGVIGARWSPIYAKLSLMSEVSVHLRAYLWLGLGASMLERESVVYCVEGGEGRCDRYKTEDRVGGLVSAAVGLRVHLGGAHALGLEVRDYSFLDSFRDDINRQVALSGGETGVENPAPGVTNIVQFDLGYVLAF